jgi:bifunctional ADP-heptose synthase (sugar kinase/adenylyltransferase)
MKNKKNLFIYSVFVGHSLNNNKKKRETKTTTTSKLINIIMCTDKFTINQKNKKLIQQKCKKRLTNQKNLIFSDYNFNYYYYYYYYQLISMK